MGNTKKRYGLIAGLWITALAVQAQQAELRFGDTVGAPQISRHIYGHFAEHLGRCVYDGIVRNGVVREDIVAALQEIKVPNLRWPGGCFADEYHWRDGVGPKKSRPVRVNTTWGMVPEDNSFGTHEFLDLCRRIGAEPYIAGNVGTGTPQEMANWIEYLNYNGKSALADERRKNGHPAPYNVSWWGVGNESWGCGGDMTPEYYAGLYKQYANFCETFPGAPRLKKIVSGANADDYRWTDVCMRNIHPSLMWGLTLHYYTLVTGHWPPSGSATSFGENEYFSALQQGLKMEEIVSKHEAIMDQHDPGKKVALLVDEWGIWTASEPGTNPSFNQQQNSLRDALLAAVTLNIFNNHAARVRGANLAQAVNVIHSIILTEGDKMVLTPTYHVFNMMKVHQDARLVPLTISSPDYSFNGMAIKAIHASASVDSLGRTHATLVNLDPHNAIRVTVPIGGRVRRADVLTSDAYTDHNTVTTPATVRIRPFLQFKLEGGATIVELPAKSVIAMEW